MEITACKNEDTLTLTVKGRLDTITAPKLESELKNSISSVKELIFDFSELEYISSAGLRVLLSAQKLMNKQGSMLLKNVCDDVMEIFQITGFVEILNIE